MPESKAKPSDHGPENVVEGAREKSVSFSTMAPHLNESRKTFLKLAGWNFFTARVYHLVGLFFCCGERNNDSGRFGSSVCREGSFGARRSRTKLRIVLSRLLYALAHLPTDDEHGRGLGMRQSSYCSRV